MNETKCKCSEMTIENEDGTTSRAVLLDDKRVRHDCAYIKARNQFIGQAVEHANREVPDLKKSQAKSDEDKRRNNAKWNNVYASKMEELCAHL